MESDIENADKATGGQVPYLMTKLITYDARLLDATTTNLTAEDIHKKACKKSPASVKKCKTSKKQVGLEGSLQYFFTFIKIDEQFFYPNTDEGRHGYLDDSNSYFQVIKEKLPNYFGLLPKADLVVNRVEVFREQDGAAQHYYSDAPDESRDSVYYAHLSDMTSMSKKTKWKPLPTMRAIQGTICRFLLPGN